jgi:hypothetical protein
MHRTHLCACVNLFLVAGITLTEGSKSPFRRCAFQARAGNQAADIVRRRLRVASATARAQTSRWRKVFPAAVCERKSTKAQEAEVGDGRGRQGRVALWSGIRQCPRAVLIGQAKGTMASARDEGERALRGDFPCREFLSLPDGMVEIQSLIASMIAFEVQDEISLAHRHFPKNSSDPDIPSIAMVHSERQPS